MKGSGLICYWITTGNPQDPLGFGVTAWSLDDAVGLLKAEGFDIPERQDDLQVRENVTSADLDQSHVVPNMGPMVMRGVWFPCRNLGFRSK